MTLERIEENGNVSEIRLWIVDVGDDAWIEHGDPGAYWMQQLDVSRSVVLSRGGESRRYVASVDPSSHDLYHRLRRQKYSWADQFIALFDGGEHNCHRVPVKLQPIVVTYREPGR